MFTAFITLSALISVPTPAGISFTAQTFAVALAGFSLGYKKAVASVVGYLALGAAGLPVFSNFAAGAGALMGLSSGFLWGLIPFSVLCGLSVYVNHKALRIFLLTVALIILHLSGAAVFAAVSNVGLLPAFAAASLPFLLKDIIMCALAWALSKRLKAVIE